MKLLNRIERSLLWYFKDCFLLYSFRIKQKHKKSLLIIKTDGIGDYLLFRNFISQLKNSSKFSSMKIVLLANSAWKDLALQFDSEEIDEFIWLDRNKYYDSFKYHISLNKKLAQTHYQYVINPAYSRESLYSDRFGKITSASRKITFEGNLSNYKTSKIKAKYDEIYSEKIIVPKDINFDFLKYKYFFEKITDEKIDLNKPFIKFKEKTPINRIAVFPGASEKHKTWGYENFVNVALQLANENNYTICLIGGKNEIQISMKIEKALNLNRERIENLTCKTSLKDLLCIIKNSKLLITNDTLTVHMGFLVNTPTVCIYKGDHYGRFQPYPKNISKKLITIMPKRLEDILEEKRYQKFQDISDIDINEVAVSQVFEASKKLLSI